jgi:hypothetical protein
MKLIETITLTSATGAILFSSIPQDATDLLFIGSFRTNGPNFGADVDLGISGSTSGFSSRILLGNGSAASSGSVSTRLVAQMTNASAATSNTFSNFSIYLPNYTGSTNKSFSVDSVNENNGTEAYQVLQAGLWSNTSAITSFSFQTVSGNFVVGTTVSLYKITKGSSGGVVVS